MSKWMLFVLSRQFSLSAICYKILLEFIYVFHQIITIFVWETKDNENIAQLMVI